MNFEVENMKKQLLNMFEQFKELDVKSTPNFYLATKIRDRLQLHYEFSKEEAETIAGNMDIDLSALGLEYEPHKEFLDSMASNVADTINKMWPILLDEFGREVTINKISKINVYLR